MDDQKNIEITEAILFSYFNNELKEAEMKQVDKWKGDNTENESIFNETKSIWEITGNVKIKPVVVDENKAWDKVFDKIENDNVVQLRPNGKRIFWGVAAALLVTIGVTYFLNSQNSENEIVELLAGNEIVEDTLSDGSVIALNSNSILTFPENFSKTERRVDLKGEAFFDVERDENNPFVIDLPNDFEVKVLGTSFNIKANDADSLTEVFVSSGKVEVSSKLESITLVKGEKALVNNRTGKIEKIASPTSENTELFWMEKSLDYESTPISEVVIELQTVYSEEIMLDTCLNPDFPIRTHQKNKTLAEVLEVLAVVLEGEYEVVTEDGKTFHYLSCHD